MVEIVEGNLAFPEHAAALLRLLEEYARDPMGGGEGLSQHTRAHLVAELRKRDTAHVILAFVDREPAGLIVCLEGFSTFACRPLLNIHDVIVSAGHRGKGLCKQMLESVETLALGLGCCKLTLEVLEGNAVARAVYESCGFVGYELDPRMGRAMFWQKKLPSNEPNPAPRPTFAGAAHHQARLDR
jgi:GNAT superfamily N-acetyltransferase